MPPIIHAIAMSDLPPPPGIDSAEWAATPAGVCALVLALLSQVQALQSQVADLQAHLQQHSGNSSRPPSSDPPSAPPRPMRSPSGRKRGGQPGHPGQHREMLPSDQVDHLVVHTPTACPHCETTLPPGLPPTGPVLRQQVWDLPPVQPFVTEHQFPTVTCPVCQTPLHTPRPPDVPPGAFGPRVTALVGVLHGRYRLSDRETAALVDDLFGLPMGLGSVPALCETVSAALAPVWDGVARTVQAQPVANVDETSWKEAGARRWLWVAVTSIGTLFRVAQHRSAAALQALLGAEFGGIVGSDRYCAYNRLAVEQRQVCWAHLKRNWQAFCEREGPVGAWGAEGVALIDRLFAAWHRFCDRAVDRSGVQQEMTSIQADLRALVERGRDELPWEKVRAFCRDLLLWWPALWTFVHVAEVAPTNNAAERALRPAVLWRKGCFGAQSANGNAFVARILTVTATCRQQQHHVLTFVAKAVRAHWAGLPAPPLISTP
jgi:transposase